MDITQRTLASSELVGFDFGVDNWIFADQFFKPSYWLILKRESFSQYSLNPLEAIDMLMYRLDTHQLIQIYHLSGVYEADIGFWDTLHIRSRVESLIMSGYIQVFNVSDAIADRMANADDSIYSNPQNYVSTGNPISDKRNELAESFGYDITERWLGKVAADQLHFDRWQIWQNIIEAYDSGATFVDTVWDLLVGLKDISVFAVSVVGNELEFQFKLNNAALKAAGNTLTGDQAAAQQALNEWGIVIGDRIKSQQEFVDAVSKKAKQGYDMLMMLYSDGLTRTLLFDYFDSLYKSMPYRKQQTIDDRIFFEIGIEVLLAIATGGLINAARRSGQIAANTTRVARATTATKRIGPLTVESIDHLSNLAKMLDKPALKTEKPSIKVYPEDLPKSKYTPREGVKPLLGDTVHKRHHPDGRQPDPENPMDYGDPYTLQADGKPMGAKEGVIPESSEGLEKFNHENQCLINEEGYPDVAKREDFKNFSDIKPITLKEGDTIYRIIDEKANPSGSYWARELPENKTSWRSDYAVKDSWNDNGYYVEHTVGKDGLKAWEGTTAGQQYDEFLEKEFYLEGGQQQLFIERDAITDLQPKLTSWPDTRL